MRSLVRRVSLSGFRLNDTCASFNEGLQASYIHVKTRTAICDCSDRKLLLQYSLSGNRFEFYILRS